MKKKLPPKTARKEPSPPPAATLMPSPGRSDRYQIWFLLAFAVALYANTLGLKYALDDALMITGNAYTKQGIAGIPEIMSNDAFVGFFGVQKKLVAGGRYRPLSQIMFAVEHELFGFNPFLGHLLNVLLYALSCGLVFIILKKVFARFHHPRWQQSLPFWASLLFICHPLHTEVVANIKGRDEILSLLFSLLSLQAAILYIDKKKIYYLLAAFPLFLLALLAKENAITFLAVVPLVIYYFKAARFREHALVMAPLLLGTLAYLLARYQALGYLTSMTKITEVLNDPYVHSSLTEKLATNTLTWGIYLKLLLFPHPLTHDYYPWHIQLTGWGNPAVLLTLLVFLGMTVYMFLGIRKKKLAAFAIAFFLITFSISSNLVFNIGTFMNERFMFVPLLGFSLLVAFLLRPRDSKKQGGSARWQVVVLIVLCVAYSAKTFSRNFTWKDDFTLFTTDVKTSVNSAKCNVSAGGMCLNQAMAVKDSIGKSYWLRQGETYLRHAISIYPGNSAAWVLLGNVFLEREDYDKAVEYYIRCLNISNTQSEALTKLKYAGAMAGLAGQNEPGIRAFQALTKFQPAELDHYVQLADLLSKDGKASRAVVLMDSIIGTNPGYADAYGKLGEIHGRVYNDIDRSLAYLIKAYNLDDSNVSTVENLGICYGFKRDFGRSLDYFKKALALDSLNPRILTNTGNSYLLMGDQATAEYYFRKAAGVKKDKP